MLRVITALPIFLALLTLCGCDKRTPIKDGFEIVSGANFGPDSHPGASVAYKGKEVWPNLDAHTFVADRDPSHFIHEGIFVFLIALPDNDKEHVRYDIFPQLVAVRGSGPVVVLSERIVGQTIKQSGDPVVSKLVPSDKGIHVEFAADADEGPPTSTHDITWAQISQWLDTPESVAPTIVKPLGTYRLLPPLPKTAATKAN
ncbi:MAG TPA: hypothetical protein VH518_19410 [Tepidisphaeraceae bacterium]